jgi:gliding motility-associated-like protein
MKRIIFLLFFIVPFKLLSQSDSLYIPNAFSPNNDGDNDYVKVYSDEVFSKFNFEIYSNYGELVFKTNNQYEVWMGGDFYYSGPTVFQYKIEYTIENKFDSQVKFGHIVLIR